MRRDRHIPTLQNLDSTSTADQRRAYADGLRALADWVESTRFPVHRYDFGSQYEPTLRTYSDWIGDDGFVRRVGSAARLIGGRVEKAKSISGEYFTLTRHFGGGVRFVYYVSRSAVCERVERTEMVEVEVPADEQAAAELQAQIDEIPKVVASQPKVVVDYVCPPSLIEAEQSSRAAG